MLVVITKDCVMCWFCDCWRKVSIWQVFSGCYTKLKWFSVRRSECSSGLTLSVHFTNINIRPHSRSLPATTLHHLAQWYCGEPQQNDLSVVSPPACCVVESGEPALVCNLLVGGLCEQVLGGGGRGDLQRGERKWEIGATVREQSLSAAALLPAAPCLLQMRNFRHPAR